MEYVEGGSLGDLIAGKNLTINDVLDIMIQICEGVREAHLQNIFHRDLKPSNILITRKWLVKIADFGLAKLREGTALTVEGTRMGTIQYMSPEQIRGNDFDERSDIFSLGVIFYELMTRQLPFPGKTFEGISFAILSQQPEPLKKFIPDVSDGLQSIVEQALAKAIEKRYQNIDSLLIGLEREKEDPLRTKTIPPPITKNKWRESISRLWRKTIPYRKYFVIAGIILTIIGFIADILGILGSFKPTVISISTVPKDVKVVLNGKFIGKTPIPDTSIQAGKVSLKFSKAGYVSIDTTIAVEKGINWMLMFTLKKATVPPSDFDSLKISSEPPRSANLIEQISKKKLDKTQPNSPQIIVEPPMFGKLNVLVKPFGSIYINRERRKQGTDVLYTESLPAGIYRLLVLHPEYGRWEEEINIKPNASLNLASTVVG